MGGKTWPAGALLAARFEDFLAGARTFDLLFEPTERKSLAGYSTTLHTILVNELDTAISERSCRVVTLLAQAGVGKSRLIEEFARLAGDNAQVVRGRCLPYGRGITFWPLVEIVRGAAGIRDDDSPRDAYAKLARLAGPESDAAVARVASAVGLSDSTYPLNELFWGTRKIFELQAARSPLGGTRILYHGRVRR